MAAGPVELMARARAGEAEALGELCALYRNYLRMVVRAGLGPRLRERVELSDVVQEALVEVVRQFPQFTGQNEAALVGWLRRLVGQKLADLGRYHSRAKRSSGGHDLALDAPYEPADAGGGKGGGLEGRAGGRLLDMLALSQTSPSEAASRRELIVLLADALAALPESEAEVLWLYHADGLSFESIGDRLGVSRKAVRGVWARGLKSLKRTLEGPPGGNARYDDGTAE
jgi:RNA polymerase sigma-70 factor (ECF subfamily)